MMQKTKNLQKTGALFITAVMVLSVFAIMFSAPGSFAANETEMADVVEGETVEDNMAEPEIETDTQTEGESQVEETLDENENVSEDAAENQALDENEAVDENVTEDAADNEAMDDEVASDNEAVDENATDDNAANDNDAVDENSAVNNVDNEAVDENEVENNANVDNEANDNDAVDQNAVDQNAVGQNGHMDENGETMAKLSVKEWYPKDSHYVFVCETSGFEPTSYSWFYGDGHKLIEIQNKDTYHIFENPGTYTVMCIAHGDGVEEESILTIAVGEVEAKDASLAVKEWYPKGNHYVFVCETSGFNPESYSWFYGDGHKLIEIQNKDTYHIFENPGEYTVKCVAHGDGIEAEGSMEITVTQEDIDSAPITMPEVELTTDAMGTEFLALTEDAFNAVDENESMQNADNELMQDEGAQPTLTTDSANISEDELTTDNVTDEKMTEPAVEEMEFDQDTGAVGVVTILKSLI